MAARGSGCDSSLHQIKAIKNLFTEHHWSSEFEQLQFDNICRHIPVSGLQEISDFKSVKYDRKPCAVILKYKQNFKVPP